MLFLGPETFLYDQQLNAQILLSFPLSAYFSSFITYGFKSVVKRFEKNL